MFDRDRIRTPLKQRWLRFRYGMLPVISFGICVSLTLWLWGRQAKLMTIVGEVSLTRVDVQSGTDGRLIRPEGRTEFWEPFDQVGKGEIIAVVAPFDNRPAQAAIETLNAEFDEIRKSIDAERARIELDQMGRHSDHHREMLRMTLDKEQHELNVIERQALIETDQAELNRIKTTLWYLEQARKSGERVVTDQEWQETVALGKVVEKRVEENEKVRDKEKELLQKSRSRIDAYPVETAFGGVDTIVAPIHASIETQRRRIDEVQTQMGMLEVRAPIDGTVAEVFFRPGQDLVAGDVILTIASERSSSIVGYIRSDQAIRPMKGWPVLVRSRLAGSQAYEALVSDVGPQFQTIPLELSRDPTRPEWVLPVRVPLPPQLDARPGELLNLTFKVGGRRGSG